MEFDFQSLIYRYTLAGARTKFEDICNRLLQRIYGPNAHDPRPSQGDDGIDVMVGDFSGPIEVYQCKFFPQGLGASQKNQIRESFQTACSSTRFTMKQWTLCVPLDLSVKEMEWWSEWKQEQQKKTGIPMVLWDGSYLLNQLRDHRLYGEVFGIEGAEQPELLTKWMVDSAAKACTAEDVRRYHNVDHRFEVMLRVIASDRDVPHTRALEVVRDALEGGRDVILGGNGGMGKTSLMLRCAVEWVRSGRTALWLSLSERPELTADDAKTMHARLLDTLRPDDTALVCIDDPYEGQKALANLRRHFLGEPRIRLMVAERSNRLNQMTDRNSDCFNNWLEDALVVTLEGLYAGKPLELGDRETVACVETRTRRERILNQCLQELEKKGSIPKRSSYDIQREVLQKYGKPNVTLVELIYRMLFLIKTKFSTHEDIVLDWDEWRRFIRKKLDKNVSAKRLYGVIAACSVFDVPMTLKLFARIFGLKDRELRDALRIWRDTGNVEPVVYREKAGTIRPKHGVIAELFFLFHDMSPGEAMEEVLEAMNEPELEQLLEQIVGSGKWTLQNGRRGRFERIDYDRLLRQILDREQDGQIRLSEEARASLLLGLLWTVPRGDRSSAAAEVLALLEESAPAMMESRTFAMLYTEWGKLLADNRRNKDAEEKFRMVMECDSRNIHSRTELGRLLSKQPGREEEAEQYLKEAIQIEPKHIQSRTELGRLLSKQSGREEEAEEYLQQILRIDPKNIQTRTELGRLLSKQPGREEEAEKYLKEAVRIHPRDIQSRTELGRLLSKQPGREEEAEEYLKEAIRIDPKNLHPHTELGRLLSKQPGRAGEAEKYLKEAIRIDPKNLHPRIVLAGMIWKERPAEAERLCREVLKIKPGDSYAINALKKMGLKP